MRIFKYLFLLLVISVSSCKKYLDTEPYSFTTVNNLYKTQAGAELGLLGCYNTLNAQSVQGSGFGASFAVAMPIMLSAGTDELVTQNGFTDPNFSPFGTAGVTSQNELIRQNWFYLYAGINRVNYLLENVNNANVAAPRLQQIIGEAHFLRGLFYMYLAMEYGAVPVYTSSSVDITQQRDTLQKVYNLVIADFQTAYNTLPHRAVLTGSANKWSAAGFLVKVYTYLASCKSNSVGNGLNFSLNSFNWVNSTDMYQKAKTISNDIIANSGYKLTQKYDYLFRETTKQWQDEESLFSITSKTNSTNGNYNLWLFWQIPIGGAGAGGGYGWFRPTGEQYYKYNGLDIRGGHNLTTYVNPGNPVEVIEGINYVVPIALNSPLNGNYCVGKYRYRDPASKSISNGPAWSDGNTPLLRFADVLLMNAEALYNTGDEISARNDLLLVRQRAVVVPSDVNTLTTKYISTDFNQELLDERSRELCFESWRRIDLIRFGKYSQAIANLSNNLGSWNSIVPQLQSNWKPFKIWFPIPNSEIELSSLIQNPGY